jgi:hypothetical protein
MSILQASGLDRISRRGVRGRRENIGSAGRFIDANKFTGKRMMAYGQTAITEDQLRIAEYDNEPVKVAVVSTGGDAAMTSPKRLREARIGSFPVIVTLPPHSLSLSPIASMPSSAP